MAAETLESSIHAAPQIFETLLGRAVNVMGTRDDPRWEGLAVRLAQTQFWLGHDQDAEQTATAALRRTRDKERLGAIAVQAVRAAGRQNRVQQALALADEVLTDLALPARWQARLRAWKAQSLLVVDRDNEAESLASEALSMARECHDRLGIGYAYRTLCLARPGERTALMAAALESLGEDVESAATRA